MIRVRYFTGQILGDRMTLQHLKAVERSEDGFDRDTWAELAKANLLGIAIPEFHNPESLHRIGGVDVPPSSVPNAP